MEYTRNDGSKITWIDTPGIEQFDKNETVLNKWWKENFEVSKPHIAFVMTARNIRCSPGVYHNILQKLLEKNVIVIFVISDCSRLTEKELAIKETERDDICRTVLKKFNPTLPLIPFQRDENGIVTYYDNLMFGININSIPFQLPNGKRTNNFDVVGIDEIRQLIKKIIIVPRNLANIFLKYTEDVTIIEKVTNWFRANWVELSRDSKKLYWAKEIFGPKGGDFFHFCLNRIPRYESGSNRMSRGGIEQASLVQYASIETSCQ